MDFSVKTEPIVTTAAFLDAAEERPVDMDVVLPDYCPDVAAILCCELCPYVTASGWNGDTLTADGTVLLRVLYLDEGRKTVHSYEMSQAFSTSFLTDGRQGEAVTEVTVAASYVHCRAVSSRRLDIHGAVQVKVSAASAAAQATLSAVNEEDVFVKTEQVTASIPAGMAQKPFSVNETLSSAEGVACVLRSSVTPTVTETKVLAGKVIVKGNLHLCALLLREGESGKTEETCAALPFSQMLDFPEVNETMTVDVAVTPTAHATRIEEEGAERVLYCATKLSLTACAWTEESTDVVTDVYSTAMPVTLQTQTVESRRLLSLSKETLTVTKRMNLPGEAAAILFAWCEAAPLSAESNPAEETRLLRGRLTVHLLYADGEGQVQYTEQKSDFSERLNAVGTAEQPTFAVTACEAFSEQEGQATVKVSLDVTRRQFESATLLAVSEVTGDENASYPKEEAAVKLVYAEGGESLWSIARSCHTSVEALRAENELEGDTLAKRTMLLIPLV